MPSGSNGDGGGNSGGGFPAPSLPTLSSGCKQTAIDGAKTIRDHFPGKIAEIGCKRACGADSSSQHCTGMATDLMVAKIDVGFPPFLLSLILILPPYCATSSFAATPLSPEVG